MIKNKYSLYEDICFHIINENDDIEDLYTLEYKEIKSDTDNKIIIEQIVDFLFYVYTPKTITYHISNGYITDILYDDKHLSGKELKKLLLKARLSR